MNIEIMKQFFPAEMDLIEQKKCPFCRKQISVGDFRDSLSIRECTISGLCQTCQDNVFGEEET